MLNTTMRPLIDVASESGFVLLDSPIRLSRFTFLEGGRLQASCSQTTSDGSSCRFTNIVALIHLTMLNLANRNFARRFFTFPGIQSKTSQASWNFIFFFFF